MNNKLFACMVALAVLLSCGKSQKQLEQEKQQRVNEIRYKMQQDYDAQVKKQQLEAERQERIDAQKRKLKDQLLVLKARLAKEQEKMNEINSFTLFRTASEKQNQVYNQTIAIESIKDEIAELQNQLNNL